MSLSNDMAIEFKNVFEKYEIELTLDGKTTRESFEALHDISFAIRKGDATAIMGPNGAGKSTLLRLIAGLLAPEKGEVKVHGRVGSLLDLGAGFHPELTGRDNLLLNASLYHFSREELDRKYDDILKFAGIGKFINAPVRCYSQGMYVRLAFSLAIHVDPDIVLIDDCLAVGDESFRLKSIDKVLELKAQHKTIVLVTHDLDLAKKICSRGIYLRESRIVQDGTLQEVAACYLKPAPVDEKIYRYLGAKISEEEEMRRSEEERRRLEEEERRRLEEERRLKAQEEERRLRVQEEDRRLKAQEERRRLEAERRRLEKEKRKQGDTLLCGPSLKFIISPAKVQIIHCDQELTSHYGLRTHFMMAGENFSSDGAIWRIKKVSEVEILCFLKWPKTGALSQVWRFKLLGDGAVDLEVMMRTQKNLLMQNERMDYCLRSPSVISGEERFHNKARSFFCGPATDFKIETLQDDQVCGVAMEGKDCFRSYFLTVPGRPFSREAKRRRIYFKGRFSSGGTANVAEGLGLASCALESGKAKIEFYDGSCQLSWGGKQLTTGLGIYTSLYSNGIWYDSTQARWKIQTFDREQLIVEGFWPWIPVAQVWEILLKDEKTILLSVKTKIFLEAPVSMQETVMMMSEEYNEWSAGKEAKEFPEGFTSDDFFRFCLWANKADGVSSLSAHSDHLPAVTFKPAAMPGHRVIVENSAHIYDVRSRLFHCLRVNKKEEAYFSPGAYEFFKGSIHIKEEKA